jgi:hypothetical protein
LVVSEDVLLRYALGEWPIFIAYVITSTEGVVVGFPIVKYCLRAIIVTATVSVTAISSLVARACAKSCVLYDRSSNIHCVDSA